jgi:uncharacterized membrane protein
MSSKFSWFLRRISSQIWFRVSLYGLAALLTVTFASIAGPLVPDKIADRVNDDTARNILSIIASSMLAVATFSLGAMVQAYSAASSSATPRATQILIDDAFTQNVISTFLGAFVFSMVGILALSLGFYGLGGEFILVIASCGVIFLVITSLFGWLDHLANLVRLGEIANKIRTRAETVLRQRATAPRLGGVAPDGRLERAFAVMPEETGYVRHIDPYRLEKLAEAAGGLVRIEAMPGHLADPMAPLARTSWEPDEKAQARIRSAFTIGPERSYDQDPRFCVAVMTEIASRALSPGINDPGTAIGIIAMQQRLLTLWYMARDEAEAPACGRVLAPALDTRDLFEDAFGPLLRDAAPMREVGIRLQKALHRLAVLGSADFADAALAMSDRGLAQSDAALALETDRAHLHDLVKTLRHSKP